MQEAHLRNNKKVNMIPVTTDQNGDENHDQGS